MATRLYLRNLTAGSPPTAGEKSTALPVGTFAGNSGAEFENLALSTNKGSGSSITKTLNSLAQTAHQDNYIARFTSAALDAQTVSANTWTFGSQAAQSNAAANSFFVLSVYIWRPSTSAVVGFVYDADTALGAEWGTAETGRVVTFSGSAVTAAARDVLVVEVWRDATQGMAASYAQEIQFNGSVLDIAEGGTGTGYASYLETPQALTFQPLPIQPGMVGRQAVTRAGTY